MRNSLKIIRQIQNLGIYLWADINVHHAQPDSIKEFLELFGYTGGERIDDFRSFDVGPSIRIYCKDFSVQVEQKDPDSMFLQDPVAAIGVAATFFNIQDPAEGYRPVSIRARCKTAEEAVQIMQLFDAEPELNDSAESGKWITYGPVSIFFDDQVKAAEEACSAQSAI